MVIEDLVALSVKDLATAIRSKQVSSVEVVEAHLERIAAVNPRLNAVVQLSKTALDDAHAADDVLARGEACGALHGVPFTVKDWIEAAHIVCAAGIDQRRDYVPKRDATVVARLKAAGGILLGKTKPGIGPDVYPAPHNPYDLSRTPGGSSGGEAAIVAACGSPAGLASDSGGSIRWPAHCCGVAGLKPTNGLVPNTGHVPAISALADPRTTIGLIAREVDDLALMLPLIAGVDWRDASVVPVSLGVPGSVSAASLRVAYFDTFERAAPSAEAAAAVSNAMQALRAAGVRTTLATPPRIEEALGITQAYWARPESTSLHTWQPWKSSTLSADDVERSLFEWDRLRRSFLAFMENFDLIVCPAGPTVAPTRREYAEEDFIYTLPYSLTGYPCVVVRAGSSPDGLPVGVQIVARPWHDHVALAAAAIVERALGGWKRPAL